MLDVNDFIAEKGGDAKKIKDSQGKRFAPQELVDQVQTMYEDHKKSMYRHTWTQRSSLTRSTARYEADQMGAKINAVQKQIGQKKKVQNQCRRVVNV
jgi:seryl-tRNA synthetase